MPSKKSLPLNMIALEVKDLEYEFGGGGVLQNSVYNVILRSTVIFIPKEHITGCATQVAVKPVALPQKPKIIVTKMVKSGFLPYHPQRISILKFVHAQECICRSTVVHQRNSSTQLGWKR